MLCQLPATANGLVLDQSGGSLAIMWSSSPAAIVGSRGRRQFCPRAACWQTVRSNRGHGRCFFRSATTRSTVSRRLCATSLLDWMRRTCLLTTYAIAGADGLFIAKEVGGDSVDLIKLFDLHTGLIFESAVRLLQSGEPA